MRLLIFVTFIALVVAPILSQSSDEAYLGKQ